MSIEKRIPHEMRQVLERELDRGERALWMGQPSPGRMAKRNLPILIFAIPWTAFAIFWMAGAAGFKIPDFSKGGMENLFSLFGIPFVLIGLGMFLSPLWAMKKAKKTIYAITDKRAIIMKLGRRMAIQSFLPQQLQSLRRAQRADGSGDIIFKKEFTVDSRGQRSATTEIGFFGIQNVKEIETMLREIG